MKTINLKDYYPIYKEDMFIDIPDELLEVFEEEAKSEQAYQRKKYRYHAQYSLDRGDGIEHDILLNTLSPEDLCQRRLINQHLHAAITSLPDKQAKRIFAHYFMGMSKTDIAKAEGVHKSQVTRSINKGIKNLEEFLKKFY